MTARLPVAPRPLADEAPSSWVRRLAARYRLSPQEFAHWIGGPSAARAFRLLDYAKATGFERALEEAAGLPHGTVAQLRLPAARLWPTDRPRWCLECIREDVAGHAEIHLRAAWTFGGCIVCPTHRRPLTDACPHCRSVLEFDAIDGRQCLSCPSCRGLVHAAPTLENAPAWWLTGVMEPRRGTASVEFAAKATTAGLLLQLQQDLTASVVGQEPSHPAVRGMAAQSFLRVVQGLMGYVSASRGWRGLPDAAPARRKPSAESLWIRPVQAAWRDGWPLRLGMGTLAVIAAVLAEADDDPRADILCRTWSPAGWDLRPVRFADLGWMGKHETAALKDLAREAGGGLERLLLSALRRRQRKAQPAAQSDDYQEMLRYLAWTRALLADPHQAARLKGTRGRKREMAISRLARTAILRHEAAGFDRQATMLPARTGLAPARRPPPRSQRRSIRPARTARSISAFTELGAHLPPLGGLSLASSARCAATCARVGGR